MALFVMINGEDRTAQVRSDSINITDEINSRNTASFELIDYTLMYTPEIGSYVVIYQEMEKVFSGTIDELEKQVNDAGTAMYYRLTCIDNNQLADRYLIAYSYVNMKSGDIVKDIFERSGLSTDEQITDFSQVQDGVTIEKINFNYCSVAQALDDLSELTGYKWSIDYEWTVWWYDRQTNPAPWELTAGKKVRNFRLRRTRENYRNRQYIRGAKVETSPQTVTYTADGETKTYSLGYPIKSIDPPIVGGAAQTISSDVSLGTQWTYAVGSQTVTQKASDPPLAAGTKISFTYTGEYPLIIISNSDNEQQARQAVEGGAGIYESVEYDEGVDKREQGEQRAQSLLSLYGKIPRLIEFDTRETGLRAGQMLKITLPSYNLDEEFMIYNVQGESEFIDGDDVLSYHVQLVGSEAPSWLNFFKGLTKSRGRMVMRENESVLLMRYFREKMHVTDTFAAVSKATTTAILTVGTSEIGFCEVG